MEKRKILNLLTAVLFVLLPEMLEAYPTLNGYKVECGTIAPAAVGDTQWLTLYVTNAETINRAFQFDVTMDACFEVTDASSSLLFHSEGNTTTFLYDAGSKIPAGTKQPIGEFAVKRKASSNRPQEVSVTNFVFCKGDDENGYQGEAFYASVFVQSPYVTANDFTVTQNDLGKVFPLELTLHMDPNEELGVSGDFTNIQVEITFPEGMEPCMVDADAVYDGEYIPVDAYGVFCIEGEDIALKSRRPVVSYHDNFDVPENWPTYDVLGANMSKTPNTTNPNHFLTIFCTTRGDKVVSGERPFTAYVKYTQEDNRSHAIGTPDEHVVLCNVTFVDTGDGSVNADVNRDGVVNVFDLNEVINCILGRETDYTANADVNDDGKVNVFDLSEVINNILEQEQ